MQKDIASSCLTGFNSLVALHKVGSQEQKYQMLTYLSVRNFTLVSELDLDFAPGMTVLTGETGAGKSILLGALGLTLGDRADMGLIASGASRAEITAEFQLSDADQQARQWLLERSLDKGDLCLLRRVLSADGRSRAYVNGSPVNVSDLKTLGNSLLDIHAQHEHQSLLRKESHRRLLDESGQLQGQVDALNEVFDAWAAVQDELNGLLASRDEQSARMQLLSYQFEELSVLAVAEGEVPALETEHKRLASAVESRQKIDEALSFCAGNESDTGDGDNIKELLNQTFTRIADIDDGSVSNVRELLSNALIQVEEVAQELSRLGNRFEPDPERLNEVDERLGKIFEMARKHKVRPEALPELTQQLQQELQGIEHADERIAELETQLEARAQEYALLADKLTEVRRAAAGKLEQAVTQHLHDLGMAGAAFVIQMGRVSDPKLPEPQASEGESSPAFEKKVFEKDAFKKEVFEKEAFEKDVLGKETSETAAAEMDAPETKAPEASAPETPLPRRFGLDDIEFLVATIPGTPPGALRKIASGGELSRISLAIQVVTAATSYTPTLVFDEVDSGIGGATAEVVGNLLHKLGGATQVLCVTHLPQVAAQGHQHYQVAKSTRDDGASMTVLPLDQAARVSEIARMLGGVEQTAESIAHAEVMLSRQ